MLAGVAACARPYSRRDFVVPASSAVAILPAGSYAVDLADVITRGLTLLGTSVAGKRVFLKPNLVEYEPGSVINTSPLVVASAAEAFRRAGAREVVVGEGPGHRRDIEYLVAATGLGDYLKDVGVRFVDLNHDDVRLVKLRSRFTGLAELALPEELLQSDFIVSMPKLKTHHWAGLTCAMKNLFGTVPGAVYGWPKNLLHVRGIPQSILDLTATVRPAFAIVDAVVSMEGDGPIMGTPRSTGFIAMSADAVSLDATCARLMGLRPERVAYLKEAAAFLGNIDESRVVQRGEPIGRFRSAFELIESMRGLRG